MPFADSPEFVSSEFGEFGMFGGDVGNLSVILKRMLWLSDAGSAAVGMGIESPTGSSVRITQMYPDSVIGREYSVHNEAVCLVPYAGFILAPSNGLFLHGFLQLNVPANGNSIDYQFLDPVMLLSGREGVLTPPTMLHVDVASGLWLYRTECPDCGGRSGLAAVLEFHYVTALSDVDRVGAFFGSPLRTPTGGEVQFKEEVADLTVGLHFQFDTNLICRVGAAFPLLDTDRRTLDSELIVQLERRF